MSLFDQLIHSFSPALEAIRERSFGYFLNGNLGESFHILIPILAVAGLLLACLGCYLLRPLLILSAGGTAFYLVYAVADLSGLLAPLLPEAYHTVAVIVLAALAAILAAVLFGLLMRFLLPTLLLLGLCLVLYPVLDVYLTPALAFAAIAVLMLFLIPTLVLLRPGNAPAILITAFAGGYIAAFALSGLIPLALNALTVLLAGIFALLGIILQAVLSARRGFSQRVYGRSYRW